jgi:hypothetical protein
MKELRNTIHDPRSRTTGHGRRSRATGHGPRFTTREPRGGLCANKDKCVPLRTSVCHVCATKKSESGTHLFFNIQQVRAMCATKGVCATIFTPITYRTLITPISLK